MVKVPATLRASSGARVLLTTLAVLLSGCASDPEELDVLVSFERGTSSWTRDATVRVDIHIIPSCEELPPLGSPANEILASTYVPKNGDPGPSGAEFTAADSFGLYAMGRNDECFVVAAGCNTIDADSEEPLTVSMRAVQVNGPPCPAGQQCMGDGECVDSPCAVLDDGDPCTFDDVDGHCKGGECLDSACAGLADRTPCSSGGVDGQCRSDICCTGCWDGTSCQLGDQPSQCGTGGERCDFVNFCR